MKPHNSAAGVDFSTLKNLAGKWESEPNKDNQKSTIYFKVTSNGTALEEVLGSGTPHEMVSIYYPVGNTVGMTHFCALGNRPNFVGEKLADNKYLFRFIPSDGINPAKDQFMNKVQMSIVDDNNLHMSWSGVKEGKVEGEHSLSFKRVQGGCGCNKSGKSAKTHQCSKH